MSENATGTQNLETAGEVPMVRPVRRKWGWVWWLGALAVLILLYQGLFSTNSNDNPAFLIGSSLGHALVYLLLFYLLVLRRRFGTPAGWVSLWILWMAFFFGELVGADRVKNEMNTLRSDMVQTLDRFSDPNTATKPSALETSPRLSGELGEIQRWAKENVQQGQEMRRRYQAELEAIGWNKILDAQRILRDRRFQDWEMICRAKETVAKYKSLSVSYLHDSIARIDRLNMDPKTRTAMKQGAQKQQSQALKIVERQWAYEAECLGEIEAIINLLAEHKEAWKVEDKDFLFYDNALLKEFRQRQAKINTIIKKEEQVEHDYFQALKEKLKKSE